jgi:hypothetical protein
MSATKRGGQRRENDFYPTPAWCVRRLLEEVIATYFPWADESVWLEPCAGTGAIVTAVDDWFTAQRQETPVWLINEPHQPIPSDTQHTRFDYLTSEAGVALRKHAPDFAITNPPFSVALDITRRMREDAPEVFVFQRLNWLASDTRAEFFRAARPSVYVLPNRPSMTEDGKTDAIEYAWFHFTERRELRGRLCVLPTTPIEERRQPIRGFAP